MMYPGITKDISLFNRNVPARILCICLTCFLFCAFPASAQISLPSSGDINTIAGNGTLGYSGDGGAATSAELGVPQGVAVDSSGNVYIADYFNAVIRKVSAVTGDIATVVGGGRGCTGETDTYGDGCIATDAILNAPEAVAVDSSGNIYIADTAHQLVRKVTASTGLISVLAGDGSGGYSGDGGPGTSAEVSGPVDVAVDSSGNVYIADENNGAIREILASTGYIYTVAGAGTVCAGATDYVGDGCYATDATLRLPQGVAVDGSGNIFIADYGNDLVREVSASTGAITAVAGDLSGGYSGDGGPATSAQLYNPHRVAVDSSGNVYISDTSNNVIRKVSSSSGYISTLAGDGTAGFSGDGGAATSAELYLPMGVALDGSANLYVSDADNNRIRAVGH